MPTRAPALLGVALALTLGLSACGGDDDTTADPPVAPSTTTPSTDPTASPTAEPPPTQAPAGETARQFIERWTELENGMITTGNTEPYRTITTACTPCHGIADTIADYYRAGGSASTEGRRVLAMKVVPSTKGVTVVRVRCEVAPTTYKKTASAKTERLPGGISTYQVTLRRTEGQWGVVDQVRLVAP